MRVQHSLPIPVLLLVLFAGLALGQAVYDINRYIENPRIFEENQQPPHVPMVPFENREDALQDDWSLSPYYQSLDGTWKFRWFPNPVEMKEPFHRPTYDASKWDAIQVPGTWQMQGYGHVIYRNVGMDFTPWDPPHVPDHLNPTGCYVRMFDVPKSWSSRRILLHFEGVKSAYFVWVNGQYVGYDQGSMTSGEFDITPYVQDGRNHLAVQVIRWSDGSYLEDQDMWRFSGIYRSVYLYALPDVHIQDFSIETDLDETYRDAWLRIRVLAKNLGSEEGRFRLVAELYDAGNQRLASITEDLSIPGGGATRKLELSRRIENPLKWSAEKPHLYRLLLLLERAEGETIEVLSETVGFREIEVRDRQVLVNGVAVEFKGVNKHEHHPDTGRTVDRQTMIRDLELMKQFNLNAVRLSHYPNDPEWYDLADHYGVYVVDEVNAECHGDETLSDDPVWIPAFVDRFSRMLERDKNHPSIVFWSTGNECGLGVGTFAMAEYAQAHDATRLMYHQGNARGVTPNGDAPFADVNGIRYPSPSQLRDHAETCSKPVVMGEYSHALANSCGHLDEYWDLIFNEPTLQGGFIWDWVDQSLRHPLRIVPDRSEHGNFGALLGRPRIVEGRNGKGLALSGIDDWVEVYTGESLDLVDEITLEMWVYPREWHGHNPLLSRSEHFTLEQSGENKLEFAVFAPRKSSVEIELPTDWTYNWHHVAASFDGENLVVGIDGKTVEASLTREYSLDGGRTTSRTSRLRMKPSQYPLNVGRNWWENHENYQGWTSNAVVDEVRIFRRAVDISELYASPGQPGQDAVLWLDFESVEQGQDFLSYGATPWASGTLDGIIFADRTPQPELWQVKKSQSPVRVEALDLSTGRLRVFNRHDFTDLRELAVSWKVQADDQLVTEKTMQLELGPHESRELVLDLPAVPRQPGQHLWLTLEFRTRTPSPGLPTGWEVAFAQFELPGWSAGPGLSQNSYPSLSYHEENDVLLVEGREFQVCFSKDSGRLTRLSYKGKTVLEEGPQLNIWRPPILNEMSIWNLPESQEWYALDLHKLAHQLTAFEVTRAGADRISVLVRTRSAPPGRPHGFENEYLYSILGSGDILLRHRATPFGDFSWFQKLGLRFEVPDSFRAIRWYGRGPQENYPDRKTGSRIATYSSKVDLEYVPYVYPQDHGNRSDVFWLALTDERGAGLAVFSEAGFNFSVDPFLNLEKAVYAFQLKEKETIGLNIDHRVTGIGGTPINVRPRYRTYPEDYDYVIRFRPYDESSDPGLMELGRSSPR